MTRRVLRTFFAALLTALTLASSPATQADDGISWRKGWCYEDEGLALVITFNGRPAESWPTGNHLGFDVRCLYGPGLASRNLSGGGVALHGLAPLAGVPTTISSGGLYEFWGLTGGFVSSGASIRGWGTGFPQTTGNRNYFVSLSAVSGGGTPGSTLPVVPQYLKRGSGGGGGPDLNPTPGAPGGNGTPRPDEVTGPGDDDGAPGPGRPTTTTTTTSTATPSSSPTPGAPSAGPSPGVTPSAGSTSGAEGSDDRVFAAEGSGDRIEPADRLTGGAAWIWILVGALVLTVYGAVTWLWLRARKARLAVDGTLVP